MNFPRAVLGLQLLALITLMVLRRAPVRVTPNPWFWLLAFVTSYGPLGFSAYAGLGVSLVPPAVGNELAVVSVIILVYSLLSLGRNIGFAPAQRKIITRGAYRFVGHPVYTGTFVSFLAFVLRGFSVLNLTVANRFGVPTAGVALSRLTFWMTSMLHRPTGVADVAIARRYAPVPGPLEDELS